MLAFSYVFVYDNRERNVKVISLIVNFRPEDDVKKGMEVVCTELTQ